MVVVIGGWGGGGGKKNNPDNCTETTEFTAVWLFISFILHYFFSSEIEMFLIDIV